MKIPELKPVTSSQISAIGFDEATKTLFIRFSGRGGALGSLYRYSNVPRELYMELITAESVGSAFYAKLKYCPETYPYAKIKEEEIEA